jgi:hypothetical protein
MEGVRTLDTGRIVSIRRRVPSRDRNVPPRDDGDQGRQGATMGTQPGGASAAANGAATNGHAGANGHDESDLLPLGVVEAPEAGGWAVVNLETLRVVEPGYVWPRREQAVRWARQELARERQDEDEYRRRQDEPVARGLARSWAGSQQPAASPRDTAR